MHAPIDHDTSRCSSLPAATRAPDLRILLIVVLMLLGNGTEEEEARERERESESEITYLYLHMSMATRQMRWTRCSSEIEMQPYGVDVMDKTYILSHLQCSRLEHLPAGCWRMR